MPRFNIDKTNKWSKFLKWLSLEVRRKEMSFVISPLVLTTIKYLSIDLSQFTYAIYIVSKLRPSWSWSYRSWIYNCLCNQILSPLKLWVRISLILEIQHYVTKFVSNLRQVGWGTPVSSTNKTDFHDITEILLEVALNTMT